MNTSTKTALLYAALAVIFTALAKPALSYFEISSVSALLYTGTGVGTAALMIADFFAAPDNPEVRE